MTAAFLLRWFRSLLRADGFRLILTLFGVALGIGVYGAIRLASSNALQAFLSTAETVTAGADLTVSSPSGRVSDELYLRLQTIPGIDRITPVSTRYLEAHAGDKYLGMIELLGVDILSGSSDRFQVTTSPANGRHLLVELLRSPNQLVLSDERKAELAGNPLQLLVGTDLVAVDVSTSSLAPKLAQAFGGRIALMDISRFQNLTDSAGVVDRFDIWLTAGQKQEVVAAAISQVLPQGVVVQGSDDQAKQATRMTEAFRVNLAFLACMSLVVGSMLVYSTASFLALKRRRDYAILLAIGMSPRLLIRCAMLEALVLGVLGGVLGSLLSVAFASSTLQLVQRTISALYLPTNISHVEYSLPLLLEFFVLGPALTIFSSWLPARELLTISAREGFSYRTYEESFRKHIRPLAFVGIALGVVVFATSSPSFLSYSTLLGFIPALALLGSGMFLAPWLVKLVTVDLAPRWHKVIGIETSLALDHIGSTIRRNSVCVAAMGVALALAVGMVTMITSFRGAVTAWVVHITKADIYISPRSQQANLIQGYLSPAFISEIRQDSRIREIDEARQKSVTLQGRRIAIVGASFDIAARSNRMLFRQDPSSDQWTEWKQKGGSALISEVFARRFQLREGDSFEIPGSKQTLNMQVGAVYFDYASDQGGVIISPDDFEKLDGDRRVQTLSLYLKDGSQAAQMVEDLQRKYASVFIDIRNSKTLRDHVMKVFDETFQITYGLQAIALIVALCIVVNTMLMLGLERRREFAVLRALGASSGSILRMVITEAGILAACSTFLGLIMGGCLAVLLVFVVNRHFFGWSIQFDAPLLSLFAMSGLAIFLSLLVGLFPAQRILRQLTSSVLRYD